MSSSQMDIERFFETHAHVVIVRVENIRGSTPREAGTWMLVAAEAIFATIGGGQLEYAAIDEARRLLVKGLKKRILDIPLGPEIGQCCGGNVRLSVLHMDAVAKQEIIAAEKAVRARYPAVYVFGAGHVGRALIAALMLLPVRAVLVDTRETEMALVPDTVEKYLVPMPEEVVLGAEPASAFVILTHEHALDFLITSAALARHDACYVGMIGSGTKRALFERWVRDNAEGDIDVTEMICPIGALGSLDKRPEVIAGFVAAEVMVRLTAPVVDPVKSAQKVGV